METSKYIKGLQVRVIPGAGHFALLTHPDQVAEHMLSFLSRAAA